MNTNNNASALDILFDQLAPLAPELRAAALDALNLSSETRAQLLQLLQADASVDHLNAIIVDAAQRTLAANAPADSAQMRANTELMIDRYRVIRELGSGGMGTVLLAERADAQYDQQVAIKLIRGFPSEDGKKRLRLERQILAQLDHPNIARLIGGGETDQGQPYLIMEYVGGISLGNYLTLQRPSLTVRLDIFAAVLSAVAHAHQRLVIHRDIKPSNVMVRTDGSIKLLDFGIAKILDEQIDSERQTSTRAFSAGFSSPEQREGKLISVTSDVYSLGKLLLEIVKDIASEKNAPDLHAIIRKASEADPELRYASVEALSEEMSRFRLGQPVRAARNTLGYKLKKFSVRHPIAISLTILSALAIGGFVWQLNVQRNRAIEAQASANRAFEYSDLRGRFYSNLLSGISAADVESGLSAKALLDRARDRLQQDETLSRGARAEISEALSSAYLNTGDFINARELAQAAVDFTTPKANEVMPASQRLIYAGRLRDLAKIMLATEQAQQAWKMLDQAQIQMPDFDTPTDEASARLGTRILLSRIWTARALYRDDVKKWTDAALRYARKHLPNNHPLTALAMGEQAVVLEVSEQYEDLIAMRLEVVALLEASPSTYKRDVADARINLARAYRLNAQFDRAMHALDAAEQDLEEETGLAMDRISLRVMLERTYLRHAAGELKQAEDCWQSIERNFESVQFELRLSDYLLAADIAKQLGALQNARQRLEKAKMIATTDALRERVNAAISELDLAEK
jgi:eukaryotic-like serine/threonine-protein kinase